MTQAYNLSQFANFLNSSGQVSAAGLQSGVTLASGTVSLFYQSAAPTGWTQVTSLNDYALRLVSSAGGTTGGTTAFSTVFANQTVSISISGTTGATTLSTAQMPSHSHNYYYTSAGSCGPNLPSNYASGPDATYGAGTDSQGGGGSHTHSFSGGGSGSITLNVRYANIIICSKN
jgi:hypothetical protein